MMTDATAQQNAALAASVDIYIFENVSHKRRMLYLECRLVSSRFLVGT
jgi:hypothetical protein